MDGEIRQELPPRMRLQNGRYYLIEQGGMRDASGRIKRVWRPLSRDYCEALRQYHAILGSQMDAPELAPPAWLSGYARDLYARTRRRATEADIYFELSLGDVLRKGEANNWRCELTGIRFDIARTDNAYARPLAPSIDRIDCSQGYTVANIRLVCVAVNAALNDWGEAVFRKIALAYCARHRLVA